MTDGQKMVWAAEFVRVLAEMEKFRPKPDCRQDKDREAYEKRVDEWWSSVQHCAAEQAAGRASLLPELVVSLESGWENGSDVLEMAREMMK